MVLIIQDKNASHPVFMWTYNPFNLFLSWDLFTFENICIWQYCINNTCGKDDQVSSIWSHAFFYKSATAEFHERDESKYMDLPAYYEGGVNYLFFQLKLTFYTMNALMKYIKLFEHKGFHRIQGKNVTVA